MLCSQPLSSSVQRNDVLFLYVLETAMRLCGRLSISHKLCSKVRFIFRCDTKKLLPIAANANILACALDLLLQTSHLADDLQCLMLTKAKVLGDSNNAHNQSDADDDLNDESWSIKKRKTDRKRGFELELLVTWKGCDIERLEHRKD